MLIGHHKQWNYLKRSLENDRMAHAYLFYGPAKIGKKTIALEFAKLLVKPLGDSNIISDLTLIEPEYPTDEEGEAKETSRAVIHIAQILDLKAKLSLSVVNVGYKAAIINEAPTMTADAQGALLKLLEEPKGKTIIILIAEHLNKLALTIVSRCQPIRFDLLPNRDIQEYLNQQKIPIKKAQEISWLSFGKPGLAIDYFDSPDEETFSREKIKEIGQLIKANLKVRFQYAEKLSKKREDINRTLEVWLNYFRELMLAKLGKKKLPALFVQQNYSLQKIRKTINLLEKIKFVVSRTNTNPRLALEILLLKI